MRLYDMTSEAIELQEEILGVYLDLDESGELTADLEARLDAANKKFESIVVDKRKKVDAIVSIIKDSENWVESLRLEAEKLEYRARTHERTANRLKQYLFSDLKRSGDKRCETLHGYVSIQKNGAVSVKPVGDIPSWCAREVPASIEFDCRAAVNFLKDKNLMPEEVGSTEVEIMGAKLTVTRGEHLRIR